MRLLVCMLSLSACIMGPGHRAADPLPPPPPKPAQPKVVSEASGSHVVTGYNHARSALAAAVSGGDSEQAIWSYVEAARQVSAAQHFVEDAKTHGKWVDGLRYQTSDDGTLDEAEMFDHLDALGADIDTKWKAHRPAALKLWKKQYGASSAEMQAKLEELGKPGDVKRDKKGVCWNFDLTESTQKWCYTRAGKLADSKVDAKAPPHLVVVRNGDGKEYDLDVACPDGSTLSSLIRASDNTQLGTNLKKCALKVRQTGATSTMSGDGDCAIAGGVPTCQ